MNLLDILPIWYSFFREMNLPSDFLISKRSQHFNCPSEYIQCKTGKMATAPFPVSPGLSFKFKSECVV